MTRKLLTRLSGRKSRDFGPSEAEMLVGHHVLDFVTAKTDQPWQMFAEK